MLLGGAYFKRKHRHSPFLCLCGLRDGVFPGVSLLSRRRLSGFPVVFAMGLGPGLIAMLALLQIKGYPGLVA